ncbi:MAG: YfhO family protein [Bacteroidota bacterium]
MNVLLKKGLPHILAGFAFLLISALYFLPQLQGEVINQTDITSHRGMSQEIKEYHETTGKISWWTNSMFGGMPAYQTISWQPGNKLKYIEQASHLFISRPIGYFFCAMLSFYILMIVMGVNHWLAAIGAIAFGLTTNSIVLFEAGHTSKMRVINYFPIVVAGVIMAYRGRHLLGGLLFSVGIGVSLYANHVQMVYYLFMVMSIYFIVQLIKAAREQQLPDFMKATGVLAVAGLLAVGSSAGKLWTTYEYGQDTMRGKPILASTGKAPTSSSETDGLEWSYATRWSNDWLDVTAAMIPGVTGGSAQEPVTSTSATYKELTRRGIRLGSTARAPLYWGPMPVTSGPAYFGAIICFLFVLGMLLVKGPIRWWLGIAVLLTVLMSLGKNFSVMNRLLFDYFPLYSKFRAPSSVMGVTGFLVTIMAVLGLHELAKSKNREALALRPLMIAGGITGAICLFFALMGPSFFDFVTENDKDYQQAGYNVAALRTDRAALMSSDAWRSLILIALAVGLTWAFIKEKVKMPILMGGLALLVAGDLWTVNRRYVNTDSFEPKARYANNFRPRPVDTQILQDKDPHYRVLDINGFQNSSASYYHKTIGGYHPAKLQRYQDLIDYHIGKNNQQVLNMLNTKYIIAQDKAQRNPGAMGNAWFISSFKMVDTPNQEIESLTGFNPAEVAVVHKEFAAYVDGLNPEKGGTIQLTSYKPDELAYTSNSSTEQLAVFSEIWYGPNKGWNAYIDGKPVEHIRVNYLLRGLRVPAGQHAIEFKFEPRSYAIGNTISLISSLMILLGFLGYIGWNLYQQVQQQPEPQVAKPKPTVRKAAPPKKTKSRRRK